MKAGAINSTARTSTYLDHVKSVASMKSQLTIDEIAKLAHVSRSVVSRVLNNHKNVSDPSRQRVLKIVKEYNYKPNSIARSLVTNSTREIGVITIRKDSIEPDNGFSSLLNQGIFDECTERGYYVKMSYFSPVNKSDILDFLLNTAKVDGIILLTQELTHQVIESLTQRDMPIILEGHNRDYPDVPSIDVDNFDASYMATKYLIDLGHSEISAIFSNLDVQETYDRMNGFKQAISDANLIYNDALIHNGDYSQKCGYDTCCEWLDNGLRFTAVLCASDTIAMGTLLALHKRGYNVPEHISVIGFDDIPLARYTIPPLTTIRQPIYNKGRTLARSLISKIQNEPFEITHVNLKPELVIRESCSPLADSSKNLS